MKISLNYAPLVSGVKETTSGSLQEGMAKISKHVNGEMELPYHEPLGNYTKRKKHMNSPNLY